MQRDEVRFEKGAILRAEMLESLYDYPRFLCEGYYDNYGDGILYGLEWTEDNGRHIISPGAVKYKGKIYFQSSGIILENENITVIPGQEYYIYFKETPEKTSFSRDVYELELSLETEPITNGFCYKYVKYELGKFTALDKTKIYGLYASPDKAGFCIPIDIIDREIMPYLRNNKPDKHPLDYFIMNYSFEHKPLPVEFIQLYISEYNNAHPDASEKIAADIARDKVRELVTNFISAAMEFIPPWQQAIAKIENPPQKATGEEKPGGHML